MVIYCVSFDHLLTKDSIMMLKSNIRAVFGVQISSFVVIYSYLWDVQIALSTSILSCCSYHPVEIQDDRQMIISGMKRAKDRLCMSIWSLVTSSEKILSAVISLKVIA